MEDEAGKMKKQRFILMYDFLFEVGGLEKLMALHAGYLKKAGYEVILLFGAIDPEILKHKIFDGLRLENYGTMAKDSFFKVLAGIFGFNRLGDLIKPEDILVSYSFPVNYSIRRFKNRKIQYMNHFPNFLYLPFKEKLIWANNPIRKIATFFSFIAGPFLKRLDKKLVKKNILLFENSQFTKKRLDAVYSINGIVSYPPVSRDFEPNADKKMLEKYGIKSKFIFASGRIIPDKRFDWLIKAFSLIKDPELELLISGQVSDKYKRELLAFAKKNNSGNKVRLLGIIPKDDLIKLYSLADVYAFPAPKEDFGLVPAEAISCGTPCVIWGDESGPTEQITEGINGYHALPYEISDYAKKIKKAIANKWDKGKILRSAKKFSEAAIEKEFLESIQEAIK
jgi:glycosyltransferase involved in cell wall biosynthesis